MRQLFLIVPNPFAENPGGNFRLILAVKANGNHQVKHVIGGRIKGYLKPYRRNTVLPRHLCVPKLSLSRVNLGTRLRLSRVEPLGICETTRKSLPSLNIREANTGRPSL